MITRRIAIMPMLAGLVLAFSLTACQTVESKPMAARLAVTVATLKVIEADKTDQAARAQRVAAVARDAQKLLDGEQVTLGAIQAAVKARLDSSELSPSDRILADTLVVMISDELRARIGDGLLSPEQRLTVSTVLDWVAVAAGG
jgi:hypothetical protein